MRRTCDHSAASGGEARGLLSPVLTLGWGPVLVSGGWRQTRVLYILRQPPKETVMALEAVKETKHIKKYSMQEKAGRREQRSTTNERQSRISCRSNEHAKRQ